LTQESTVNGQPSTVTYAYDIANRMIDVNYDFANRTPE
jgi:hypothetical protein